MKRIIISAALVSLVAGASTFAHEQSLHKGRATEGEVTAVSETGLTLKTVKGTVPVTVSEKTQFERGEERATRQDVHQGDSVSVFGTVLADGEVVAREIVIHRAGSAGKSHEHHDAE